MSSELMKTAADIHAAFRRAGFRIRRARVSEESVVIYLKAEDWERFRKTLLRGVSALYEDEYGDPW